MSTRAEGLILDMVFFFFHMAFPHATCTNPNVLRHGRDVHPTWVKLFTETLSNRGSEYKCKVLKGTLTVTDDKW